MKLPKIDVRLTRYEKTYTQEFHLQTRNIYGEVDSFYTHHYNYVSKRVFDLLTEQSRFYDSIEEPTWKLIKYIEENPESVEFSDSTTIVEYYNSDSMTMKQNIKQLILNKQNIDLGCFNKNELSLIELSVFETGKINKKVNALKTRLIISDLVDKWNEIDE